LWSAQARWSKQAVSARASPSARAAASASFSLLALIISALPIKRISAADQAVLIPKPTVDLSVWKANWQAKYAGPREAAHVIYDEFLIQLYKKTPALSPQAAVAILAKLQSRYAAGGSRGQDASYRDLKTYDEISHIMFDVAALKRSISTT
jgi:hypothetical protein